VIQVDFVDIYVYRRKLKLTDMLLGDRFHLLEIQILVLNGPPFQLEKERRRRNYVNSSGGWCFDVCGIAIDVPLSCHLTYHTDLFLLYLFSVRGQMTRISTKPSFTGHRDFFMFVTSVYWSSLFDQDIEAVLFCDRILHTFLEGMFLRVCNLCLFSNFAMTYETLHFLLHCILRQF